MIEHDFDGMILDGNPALEQLTGRPLAELIGRSWFDLVHPDDQPAVRARVATRAAGTQGPGPGLELRLPRPDGSERHVKAKGALLAGRAGLGWRVLLHLSDVTTEHAHRQALEQAHSRFSALLLHGTDIISVLDGDLVLRYVSPAYASVLGGSAMGDVGGPALARAHPDDLGPVEAALRSLADGHQEICTFLVRMESESGQWRVLEVTATNRLDDPAISGLVCNGRDVTERVEATERLEHQALHDNLTGLANRALLAERLDGLRQPPAAGSALFFLDLDRFKTVNDRFGHAAGDQLLMEVAERLRNVVRPTDTVARLGGDEFVVLACDVPDEATAVCIAERTCAAVSAPLVIQGHQLVIGCSIGIAFAGDESPEVLLAQADLALYRAKASEHQRWEFYDPAQAGRPGPTDEDFGAIAILS